MKKETKKEIAAREKAEAITQENNTMIALFMGGHFNPEGRLFSIKGRQRQNEPDNYGYHLPRTLKYHSDWNWLMPVVAEIHTVESLGIAMHYEIEKQYAVVISYIKSFNERRQEKEKTTNENVV